MSAASFNKFKRVNPAFTILRYRDVMTTRAPWLARSFSILALLFVGLMLLVPQSVRAQNGTVHWADAGVPSQGALPSGTVVAGSDGTTATITWTSETQGGGSFEPAFAPTFVSYFSGTIGSGVSPLLLSFDNSSYDPRDRIVLTITLNRAVSDLNFSLGDIDNGNFADAVEVYHDNDLNGAFSNAAVTNSFWTTGSAVTRTNDGTVNGWRGTSNSGTSSINGNVNFDFGNQQVRRIQIVYFSYTGSGNPGTQFMGVSDLEYTAPSADLSLTKTLVGGEPNNGGDVTWRLTVTSAANSSAAANGIVVRDTLPAAFTFDNASGTGSFNAGNGDWNVGALAPGASASIDITGTINAPAGTSVTNVAEIIASSLPDPDSSVSNGAVNEDDYASSRFTVVADSTTVPPALPCPAGEILFDWDGVNWAGGSLNNSYQLGSFGTIGFDIVTNGVFASRTSFGGAVPALTTAVSGGLNPQELALAFNKDNTDRSQQAVTTITLPTVFTGAQFSVFDIDRSNTFEDRVTVYGFLSGVRVDAILTPGASNAVSGASLIGTSGAGDTTSNGTGVFTFLDPVDTIVIEYGNGPGAPANPTNQSIAIHDFSFCLPAAPDVLVSKVSSIIADPVNGTSNPKAIPGATVEYLITVTNSGNAPADFVTVWDNGPADAKLCLINRNDGPIIFNDPGGNSNLTYAFSNLSSATDNLEFSNDDGASFNYTPVADSDGCDTSVTDFRVRPTGAFAAGATFTITVRFRIE